MLGLLQDAVRENTYQWNYGAAQEKSIRKDLVWDLGCVRQF